MTDRDDLPDRPGGQPAHHREQIIGGGGHSAPNPEHDAELQGFGQQVFRPQSQARLQMPGVIDFQFRFDVQFPHACRQPTNRLRRVAEFARAEAHRARIQRGHPRAQLDQLLALLEGHRQADPGGQLDQDRTPLADEVHGPARDVRIRCGPFVFVAQVDVGHRGTGMVGLLDGCRDFLGARRQRRVVGLGGDGAGGCDGDDDAHSHRSSASLRSASSPVQLITPPRQPGARRSPAAAPDDPCGCVSIAVRLWRGARCRASPTRFRRRRR